MSINSSAYYDARDRTIHNAEVDSMAYFHELRHKQQHVMGWFRYEQYINLFVFATALLREWWLVLPVIAYNVFIELDAVGYSVRMRIRQKIRKMFGDCIRGRL